MGIEYDNSAFYYFSVSLLGMILIPDTIYMLYVSINRFYSSQKSKVTVVARTREEKNAKADTEQKEFFTIRFIAHIIIYILMWFALIYFCYMVADSPYVLQFDPFQTLGIEETEDPKIIKKAYRNMAKLLHPDLNPDDPDADTKFGNINRAYKALTDEVSKENWLKYGNPDGPQPMSVSIGLPSFILESEYKHMVMGFYLIAFVILIPYLVWKWHSNAKKYGTSDVQVETYDYYRNMLAQPIKKKNDDSTSKDTKNGKAKKDKKTDDSDEYSSRFVPTTIKDLPQALGASAEFKELFPVLFTKEIVQTVSSLARKFGMPKPHGPTSSFKDSMEDFRLAAIHRNSIMIQAWLLKEELEHAYMFNPKDVDIILRKSMRLCEAMVEVTANPRTLLMNTTLNVIDFMQYLTQRMWLNESELSQLPHFTSQEIKHATSGGKNSVKSLRQYIDMDPKLRKGLAKFSDQQREEVNTVLDHYPRLSVAVDCYVEDEDDIYCGDVVTVNVTIIRENLKDGDKAQPVYAPNFPLVKEESWWLLVSSPNAPNNIQPPQAIKKVTCQDRVVKVSDLKILTSKKKSGKIPFDLYLKSADYIGLDLKYRFVINVKSANAAPAIEEHPDDKALDNEKSFFEQMKQMTESGTISKSTDNEFSDGEYSDDE